MVNIIKGNIFTTTCQTIVNTINCVGIMGAGIAYECRLRYPEMFNKYVTLCKEKKIDIGILWLYKSEQKWILNFPTKYDWKYDSKIVYLEKGLQKFVETYREKNITSIAFPLLGASKGNIPENISLDIMRRYLDNLDIYVEIYYFDPNAEDDIFLKFKKIWFTHSDEVLSRESGIRIDFVRKVKEALQIDRIKSMSSLLSIKGIGDKTLEKAFKFANSFDINSNPTLFG